MDPIRPKITPNLQPGATPPATPADPAAATRKFDVGTTGPVQHAPAAQTIARPNFDRIRTLVNDPSVKSLSREQLREHVIASETRHLFGDHASPQMVAIDHCPDFYTL